MLCNLIGNKRLNKTSPPAYFLCESLIMLHATGKTFATKVDLSLGGVFLQPIAVSFSFVFWSPYFLRAA